MAASDFTAAIHQLSFRAKRSVVEGPAFPRPTTRAEEHAGPSTTSRSGRNDDSANPCICACVFPLGQPSLHALPHTHHWQAKSRTLFHQRHNLIELWAAMSTRQHDSHRVKQVLALHASRCFHVIHQRFELRSVQRPLYRTQATCKAVHYLLRGLSCQDRSILSINFQGGKIHLEQELRLVR